MRSKILQIAIRLAGQIAETQVIREAPIKNSTQQSIPPVNPILIPNQDKMNPNFIPVDISDIAPLSNIRKEIEREESKRTFQRDFEKFKEDMLTEGKQYSANNSAPLSLDQKTHEVKVDPVSDTNQKTDQAPARRFTSAKGLQDEVFKKSKEQIQNHRPLLFLFNVFEGTLKKSSSHLFEGFYCAFADKDGIPDEKAKSVLNLAKWLVLAIITFTLYEYFNKKLNEVKNLDAQALANYSQAKDLYDKAILLAQECVRQINSINELTKNKDLNENLLKLLKECADSEENNSILGMGINNLTAVIESVVNNKLLERALLDGKIERRLQSLEDQNPLASLLLEKKGAKGYKSTENALQYKVDTLDIIINHKKEGVELRQKEIQLNTDRIEELNSDTKKIEIKVHNNLFVRSGFFKPVHHTAIDKCEQCKEKLKNIKADNKEENKEDDLRFSVD
ncbi:hypothetical protein Lgra_1684 [Legionella gratiana]|uniref:Uncharacterized protein n=1 Tax=Legionella gratiana TaxID=45066 RepID=A0A378J7S4_9GAMM|nr:hypothetical protein [Legionella gratiana]KTD10718.1 hypothetical protein Lgra_1684 [Legionella gratiana]STX43792.1 Uncharacterised protein [Legionella gratiana]